MVFEYEVGAVSLWDRYSGFLQDFFDSMNQQVENNAVFAANSTAYNLIESCLPHLATQDFHDLIMVVLRFIVPTTDGTPWLIRSLADNDKLKTCL